MKTHRPVVPYRDDGGTPERVADCHRGWTAVKMLRVHDVDRRVRAKELVEKRRERTVGVVTSPKPTADIPACRLHTDIGDLYPVGRPW